MLSLNAISLAGEGLPSSADIFRHAKIAAMTPRVLRKDLRQRKRVKGYTASVFAAKVVYPVHGVAMRFPTQSQGEFASSKGRLSAGTDPQLRYGF